MVYYWVDHIHYMDLIRNAWDDQAFKPEEVNFNAVHRQELVIRIPYLRRVASSTFKLKHVCPHNMLSSKPSTNYSTWVCHVHTLPNVN